MHKEQQVYQRQLTIDIAKQKPKNKSIYKKNTGIQS